jgi:hypothetical protein
MNCSRNVTNPFRRRSFGWIAFVALAAGCSPPTDPLPVQAPEQAAEKNRDIEEWRKVMARTPHPKEGCFQAKHPGTSWIEVPCVKPPGIPFLPRTGEVVGNAARDVSAAVAAGTITWSEGSFPQVTGVTANGTYSLQLNTNVLPSSTLCQGASLPATCPAGTPYMCACRGWQQFLYASETNGGQQMAYIQYWLINYNNQCPSGWTSTTPTGYLPSCFIDSVRAVPVPTQPLSNLQNLALIGTAGTSDAATLSVSGILYGMSQGSTLNLLGQWTTAEFNVFGNGNGTQVAFNAGSTIVAQVLTDSTSGTRQQPSNSGQSFTAETNNLSLVGTPCTFGGDHPGIQFMESNAAGATAPSCPSLASTSNPVLVPAGASWSTNLNIQGNLVGQSTNTALLPSSCSATGPVSWSAFPASLAQGIGPEIDYSIPAGTTAGISWVDGVTCDNGQSLAQTITAVSPLLTANPSTITVQENSCATGQYAGASLVWANDRQGYCDTITYNVSSTLPQGIQAYTNNAYVAVCDASGHPQSFDLTVTSDHACVGGNATATVHVNVVSCIPKTCAGHVCGQISDGCGGTLTCGPACPPCMTQAQACAAAGASCGSVSTGLGCPTVSCGTCGSGSTCNGGTCSPSCHSPATCCAAEGGTWTGKACM